MKLVASRLRLNVYLHSRGPALRRIEPVCDDLELIDGIMAVLRLPERVCGRILSRLLASTLIWIFRERCVNRILCGEVFGRRLLVWSSRSRKSGHAGEVCLPNNEEVAKVSA
ncbi:MAG TPA: hypothetical protein VLN58_11430, partial [Verrucomicrobiae bacterium]|nr:hypothetical protein [Verrucomicrobiae bacterium]